MEYENVVCEEKELGELWEKILGEYNKLEKNFGSANFLSDKTKIVYYYTLYLNEQAMFKSLLYRTNVEHIRKLRLRGYEISNKSQVAYWQSLQNGLRKVENHLTYIQILKNKIKDVDEDSKKTGNPFDEIMAWIASNDIKVDENITVSRYIKVKEIILKRQRAKQKDNSKSKLHGGGIGNY